MEGGSCFCLWSEDGDGGEYRIAPPTPESSWREKEEYARDRTKNKMKVRTTKRILYITIPTEKIPLRRGWEVGAEDKSRQAFFFFPP